MDENDGNADKGESLKKNALAVMLFWLLPLRLVHVIFVKKDGNDFPTSLLQNKFSLLI